MLHSQDTGNETGLLDQISSVAEDLKGAIRPVVNEVAGPRPRPSRISRRLNIDQSLASRLARAFRSDDPFEFMHVVPAPTGLRMFLVAARDAKIDLRLCERAGSSIEKFQMLIDRTPGGRATLDAAISASSPGARSRNERSSKQAVYKGMSYLLGFQCEAAATAFIIRPSADGQMVDSINIHHRKGIRRLRPSAPVTLSTYKVDTPESGEAAPRFESLGGVRTEKIHELFLKEFSTDPLPRLEVVEEGNQTTIALSEDGPPPESPFDLTFGMILRNSLRRYGSKDCTHEWRNYLLYFPCKTMVRDVFIRDDLYVGTIPELTLSMPSFKGPETVRRKGISGRLNTLDLATPIERLGTGLRSIRIREMPAYLDLISEVFEQAGWDASRFRVYRVKTIYPVPMISMNWWFPLPEAPGPPG